MKPTGPCWMVVYRRPLMSGHYVLWCHSTEPHEHAVRRLNPSTGEVEMIFGACPNGTHHPRTIAEPEHPRPIAETAGRWNPLPARFQPPRVARAVTADASFDECAPAVA